SAGRHRIDAIRALGLVFGQLYPHCRRSPGLTLALPAYLSRNQQSLVTATAENAKLRVFGTIAAPLATALGAHALQPWTGLAVVADADDHAFTWAAVRADDGEAVLVDSFSLPRLGLRACKERVLNALAERCVRQSRWDPRDAAPAEQSLYDQI